MAPDHERRLRVMAHIIVRTGLNLQPGQRLLITDPYELQGVHPDAGMLVEAVRIAAIETGCPPAAIEIITADPARLRLLAETNDTRRYKALLDAHTQRMERHLAAGGAFLFLTGSHPGFFADLPPAHLARFDQLKWSRLGPIIQRLIRGVTQWSLVPAPTPTWANTAFADLYEDRRLGALWDILFTSLRIGATRSPEPAAAETNDTNEALQSWQTHLDGLARRRNELNAARHRAVRYTGIGTDLTLPLPRFHRWCTTQQTTRRGVPFVINLPTEEIFTAPHHHGAEGRVRISRPVQYAGSIIEGIDLELIGGKVVAAHATRGHDILRQMLKTDAGACYLGEVAIVTGRNRLNLSGRFFHHILLDENASHHIALGDAYPFCSRAWFPRTLNSSQIHVDLPLDATVELL